VAKAAGATYVAKYTTAQPIQISNAIREGLENKGFSFIEVVAQCPTYYGRKNKIRSPVEMLNWLKENTITIEQSKEMSEEELEGKIITGVYINKPRKEFVESLEEITSNISDINPDTNINRAYRSE
jgi:2-oxoglutarate ferredoxin oxidoreductase subunit beta